jgi:hypothetical protein
MKSSLFLSALGALGVLLIVAGGGAEAQLAAAPLHDAGAAPVVIPWGAWLAAALDWARTGIVALLSWAVYQFAPPLLKLFLSQSAIERAVDAAIASVEGATRGQKLSVEISNAVAERALAYIVDEEPSIAKWLGATLGPRILAQMSKIGVTPTAALTAPF